MLDARAMLELVRIMLDPERWWGLTGKQIRIFLPKSQRTDNLTWLIHGLGDGYWVEDRRFSGTVAVVIPTHEALHLGVKINEQETAWIPLAELVYGEVEIDISDLMPAETPVVSTATP